MTKQWLSKIIVLTSFIISGSYFLSPDRAFALGLHLNQKTTDNSAQKIMIHPFASGKAPKVEKKAFGLMAEEPSFLEKSLNLVKQSIVNPNVMVKVVPDATDRRVPLKESYTFGFFVNEVELCGLRVKSHLLSSGHPVIFGRLPALSENEQGIESNQWPEIQLVHELIRSQAASSGSQGITFGKSQKCYFVKDELLTPSWQLEARIQQS